MMVMDAKVDSQCLLRDYDDNEAGLRQIKLNHHESTNEERASESSPMDYLCDIVTAVCIEDSSEEYIILDELRRLIQNKTAMSAFYSGALFGAMACIGVISFLIHMDAPRIFSNANLPGSMMYLDLLFAVTTLLILFVERTVILNIFRALYESRNIRNEFTTDSIISFIDSRIITGMVLGVCLTWVLLDLATGFLWMALVALIFSILIIVHNSITCRNVMNGDVDCK
eukprot:scaffold14796_cov56-Attheya_sp.AAC.2